MFFAIIIIIIIIIIAIYWIGAKISFAIVRSAILCLRGSRSRRRQLDLVKGLNPGVISKVG